MRQSVGIFVGASAADPGAAESEIACAASVGADHIDKRHAVVSFAKAGYFLTKTFKGQRIVFFGICSMIARQECPGRIKIFRILFNLYRDLSAVIQMFQMTGIQNAENVTAVFGFKNE